MQALVDNSAPTHREALIKSVVKTNLYIMNIEQSDYAKNSFEDCICSRCILQFQDCRNIIMHGNDHATSLRVRPTGPYLHLNQGNLGHQVV